MKNHPESRELDRLIALIADGDRSALAALYQRIGSGVYSYALSVLKDRHDAEDVLQDTLLEIWQAAPAYTSQGKPMAWVITIAKNFCLMKLRENRRRSDIPPEELLCDLCDESLSPEDKTVIRLCIEELSPEEREIVILHAVAGLKHREIAKIQGLPISTVLSKYQRTIKKLKIKLEGLKL